MNASFLRNMRVYLAGPDVFLPDPHAFATRKKAICHALGLCGVAPLDPLPNQPAEWAALPEWRQIALRNEAHITSCDAVIANLTPFRGPSADVGTVYEIGFARGLGKPVFAYSNVSAKFTARTLDFVGNATATPDQPLCDTDGLLIEQFGRSDNLMIEGGIIGSGGALVIGDCDPAHRWQDLTAFERCVALAAQALCPGTNAG